jgi:hypothetical protein
MSMTMTSVTTMPDRLVAPPADLGVQLASRELASLMEELEVTLYARQASLLHQIRLTAESLGAARASLVTRFR